MASPSLQDTRGSALLILLIVVVLALSGGIVFVLLQKKTAAPSEKAFSVHNSITATTPSDIKTLLTDAKAGKYQAKCTYTTMVHDTPTESTIYVGGAKKLRVDTPINDKAGHLIRLDDSAYLWADGDSKGSKLPMTDESTSAKYTPDTLASKAQEYHMKCESVDKLAESLFTLPSGVTFVDLNAQIKSSSYGN